MAVARRTSRRRYVLLVIVLTAVTLITLDTRNGRSGPLGALGRAAHTIVGPLQDVVSSAAQPLSDWWHGLVDAGHLRRENRRLRQDLAAALGKERDADRAIAESEMLKRILDLPILADVPRVTARISGRDPGNFDSTLTIDKGTEKGIAKDMAVIAPDGLVGKVIDVWRGGAQIRVLTDPLFAVGVQSPSHPGENASTGTALGRGTRDLVVDDFDAGAKIVVGDELTTSPLSTNIFPPDLPVGRVTRVTQEPAGLGMHVSLAPYVDVGGLQYVTVLLWVPGQGPVVSTTTTSTTTTTSPPVPFGVTTTVGH